MIAFKGLCLSFFFVMLVENGQGVFMPLHASCKIEWDWPQDSCAEVVSAIAQQIQVWNNTDCETGEKCRYTLISKTSSELTATHTTPKKMYVDDLTFKFSPTNAGGCNVEGNSRSEVWYAVLDYGTNYCNLHNLITGAGLNKKAGYDEKTSNSICTQYSSANCDVY